jgi:hypothetical protein
MIHPARGKHEIVWTLLEHFGDVLCHHSILVITR